MKYLLFILISFISVYPKNTALYNQLSRIQNVRVLLESVKKIKISDFSDELQIFNDQDSIIAINQNSTIKCTDNFVEIMNDSVKYACKYIKITSQNSIIEYKKNKYKGFITVFPVNKALYVINSVNFEDYVLSVCYNEVKNLYKDSKEALKAFAVCIRNYTYLKVLENRPTYDLYSDSRDQVYNGVQDFPQYIVDEVHSTKNSFLSFNDDIAQIYYHASCGGSTQSYNSYFHNKKSFSYLTSVKDPDSAVTNSSYNWKVELTDAEILRNIGYLTKSNLINYKINDVGIIKDNSRICQLNINISRDKDIKNFEFFGSQIRQILGESKTNKILKSNNFDYFINQTDSMKICKNRYVFDIEDCNSLTNDSIVDRRVRSIRIMGKGAGHGVGFCQVGAKMLALENINYEDILRHYFIGTKVERLDE